MSGRCCSTKYDALFSCGTRKLVCIVLLECPPFRGKNDVSRNSMFSHGSLLPPPSPIQKKRINDNNGYDMAIVDDDNLMIFRELQKNYITREKSKIICIHVQK